jgi:PPOX class probable F420-dependent enzyme
MSLRAQLVMSDDEVAAFLDEGRRAHIATLDADGMPHLVPLAYVMVDGLVTLWTDPRSRKVKNLRRDPRISCLVEAGASFPEFRAVQLKGRAEVADDPDTVIRAGIALFERSRGPLGDDLKTYVASLAPERVAVFVHPEVVVSWDHRKVPGLRPDQTGS